MQITEGPVWEGSGLLYTNIANNRILRYDPATGESTEVRTGTNAANGLMLDQNGVLYACEGGGRRMVRYDPVAGDASTGVTVICDNFAGKRLTAPTIWPSTARDASGSPTRAMATTATTWSWTTSRSTGWIRKATARGSACA